VQLLEVLTLARNAVIGGAGHLACGSERELLDAREARALLR
jgi:hypothetical protein